MKRLLLSFTLLLSISAFAQEGDANNGGMDPSRIFFGGNFGLTFGNFTFINVSPQVGYRISPKFAAGGGVNFIYQSNKVNYGSYQQKSTYAYTGLNIFGRVNPYRFLLANVQPELNYVWGKTTQSPGDLEFRQKGKFVPSVLVGAGVAIPAGQRSTMVAMLQYDVVQDVLSPYGRSAFFTFGFNF